MMRAAMRTVCLFGFFCLQRYGYSNVVSAFAPLSCPTRGGKRKCSTVTRIQSTASPSSNEEQEKSKIAFERARSYLCSNVNIVQAGGWHKIQQLAANPKEALVRLVVDTSFASSDNKNENIRAASSETLFACLGLLAAQGKGFSSDLVDGEWASVLNVSGKKSPNIQKLVARGERVGFTYSNFDVRDRTFNGNVKLFWNKGDLRSIVRYNPVGSQGSYSVMKDGKIVIRRIACDIIKATWKFWFFPRVSLPFLKVKGGYLDFVYLDKDIRITKGNRGGIFVHFRPAFLQKVLEQYKTNEDTE